MKSRALRKIATPYSLAETLGVIWRNTTGLDHRNRGAAIEFLSHSHGLNPIIKVESSIAFVGDIMSVGKHRLAIDESVAAFLSGSDYLVGNLEATITQKRHRRGILFGALQWQKAQMVNVLAEFFPPAATYLSLANNHTGDFEDRQYLKSCTLLEERGFNLFGQADRPYVDLDTRIRLHGGTMWSNQICRRIHRLGSAVREAFDERRVNAYSLGDFCSKIPTRAYRYGIIAKLAVGPGFSGDYRIGHVHWRFVECRRRTKETLAVRVVDQVPYFKQRPDPKRLLVSGFQ